MRTSSHSYIRHSQYVSYYVCRHDEFYPSGATTTPDISTIINPAHFHRLKKLLDSTAGTIAFGGQTDESRKFIAPTVVKGVKDEDSLMSECVYICLSEYFQATFDWLQRELFGPILPIMPVDDVDAAIAYINAQ